MAETEQGATSATTEIPLRDEGGADLGTVLKVGPSSDADGEPDSVESLAARVTGWTKFVVDGEAYTFSKGRALALLNRFPHFAAQIRAALNEGT